MGYNIITVLPVVSKDLLFSLRCTPYSYEFLSRCGFSTLTTRQPIMAEIYLLTFSRFPLRKKEHKLWSDKNRTNNDFRSINSRCTDYLEDHSGDECSTTLLLLFKENLVVFTLKTVLTSIQYPSLSYSSRQRNEFPWSQGNPK